MPGRGAGVPWVLAFSLFTEGVNADVHFLRS